MTQFAAGRNPEGLVAGSDGNLWFTEHDGRFGRVTPQGIVTEFRTGLTEGAAGIATGPDGNLWFTEKGNRIGRFTVPRT